MDQPMRRYNFLVGLWFALSIPLIVGLTISLLRLQDRPTYLDGEEEFVEMAIQRWAASNRMAVEEFDSLAYARAVTTAKAVCVGIALRDNHAYDSAYCFDQKSKAVIEEREKACVFG